MGRAETPLQPAHPEALSWLLRNQLGDGTWGSPIGHHQDRVISTLAGMLALAQWRELSANPEELTERLHTAAWGIAPHAAALGRDPCDLIDFGPAAAALLAEARWRHLVLPIEALKNVFSSGTAGRVQPAPAGPLPDGFEQAWVLHHVALAFPDHAAVAGSCQGAVAALERSFPALAASAQPRERAAAAVAFRVLTWAGRTPDPTPLLQQLSEPDLPWDGCDRPTGAVGAQAYLLGALRSAPPFAGREPALRKIIGLLARTASPDHFWIDGQHASPHHATSLAVIGLGCELSLTEEAVAWIEQTQRPDGSWGYYQMATAEETASCLQALVCHRRAGGRVRPGSIEAGARWLTGPAAEALPDQPLWVDRSLYQPTRVVRSAVLSARVLSSS